jgi:hypothetical protein
MGAMIYERQGKISLILKALLKYGDYKMICIRRQHEQIIVLKFPWKECLILFKI